MKTVTFNVLVDNGGELYVDIDVTEKEFNLLKKFSTKYYDCDEDSEEFEDCEKLESIDLPSSVTQISYGQFNGCTNIDEFDIPDDVYRRYVKPHFENCKEMGFTAVQCRRMASGCCGRPGI